MQRRSPRRIGILAGGRSLPMEIAEGLRQRGASVHIVALEGEAEPSIEKFDPTWVNWGQIGAIIGSFKKHGCRQIAIAGSVRRPDLATIKPDLGFFRALPTVIRLMRAGGDDAILRGVIGYLEKMGLEVVGVDQVAPELVVGRGRFAGPSHKNEDLADIRIGFRLVRALAPFDIGQAVVVADGRVEAIEGAEGTDRMLDRLTGMRHKKMLERQKVARGVLVKAPKPGQELRVDMPAIGPETVRKAAGADLKGIAVQAGKVLAVERAELCGLAETHRVFVAGFDGADSAAGDGAAVAGGPASYTAGRLGKIGFSKSLAADAAIGAQLVRAAAPFGVGRAAVVERRHALAVEDGTGIAATISRAGEVRQWGRQRRRHGGVVILSAGRDLCGDVIEAASAAGFAGVAVVLNKFAASVGDDLVGHANRRKLFVAVLAAEERG